MAQNSQTLDDIIGFLSSSDAQKRMSGIILLSKRNDATARSVMLVGELLKDEATYDPNPNTYGPAFIPKWVPSVQACAKFHLPYIAKNSPRAIVEIAHTLMSLSPREKQTVYDVISNIGTTAMCKVLMSLDEEALAETCAQLRGQANPKIHSILDAFSTPLEHRAKNVISSLILERSQTLINFPEEIIDVGPKAIPFLGELIKINAENPSSLSFAWKTGLTKIFSSRSKEYQIALKAISALELLGNQSEKVLLENAQSNIKEIRLAILSALEKIKANPKYYGTSQYSDESLRSETQVMISPSLEALKEKSRNENENTIVQEKLYQPKVGDIVIGTVAEVSSNSWLVDIESSSKAILLSTEATLNDTKDLSRFLNRGDHIIAKISSYFPPNGPQLSVSIPGLGKLTRGQILKIKLDIIPRIVDKKGKVIETLKKETNCHILVGLNGVIAVVGKTVEEENRAIERIRKL